eukprot:CAMPEP_0205803812 /NCGR_PEP_ID=MMETSP0205-20121125/6557_1 /ASSEMBLY_ACC=CAM_ASM_000278 /TAXON_ID=36767 /ORGANISM="Euplotes focardii, Strain TN1" /LENGTH=181 /DNA_ID=CAMNT_0053072447 /DNA_START=45 /DNA_END=591 /DNA_ORIENTATION=-
MGFKKVKTFDINTQQKLGNNNPTSAVKMNQEEKKFLDTQSQDENENDRDLIQQNKASNDQVSTGVKSTFYDEPIPDMVVLKGFMKERALVLITGYQMQHKVTNINPDEEVAEMVEKVSLIRYKIDSLFMHFNTPIRKEYVLRLLPDFKMEFNQPFDKIEMGEGVLKKLFDKMEEEYEEKES